MHREHDDAGNVSKRGYLKIERKEPIGKGKRLKVMKTGISAEAR